MITVKPRGEMILIQFRADEDIASPAEWTRLRCRITTFKGTALGTLNDGYDVIAAFPNQGDAARFMTAYDRDGYNDYHGDIGAFILAVPVTIDL